MIRIDFSALQDVLLITCIFVIFTMSFSTYQALESEPNEDHSGSLWCCDGCDSLLVQLDQDNKVWISGRFIDQSSLLSLLKGAKYNGAADMGLIIRAHENAKVDHYTKILDAANRAGITDVQFSSYN